MKDAELALREHDYGISNSIGAFIEALGMMSENMQRQQRGESMAYPESAFHELMEDRGLHHNAIVTRWEGKI